MGRYARRPKRLGQNFLINRAVAVAEAEHAEGKHVLEIGPGRGMLTRELCRRARRVVAVELDNDLFRELKANMRESNLRLVNSDFLDASGSELELGETDIVISNIPYSISSKVIDFLLEHRLQAVLCLQKEFVEHMTARAGTRGYSRLSVMFQLCFSYTRLMRVSRGSFRPIPKVDSEVIYAKPKGRCVSGEEKGVINAIMQHKKKTVRNAILDSHLYFRGMGCDPEALAELVSDKEARVFKLEPERVLALARELIKGCNGASAPARG